MNAEIARWKKALPPESESFFNPQAWMGLTFDVKYVGSPEIISIHRLGWGLTPYQLADRPAGVHFNSQARMGLTLCRHRLRLLYRISTHKPIGLDP